MPSVLVSRCFLFSIEMGSPREPESIRRNIDAAASQQQAASPCAVNPACPKWVMGCRRDHVGITAGVPQIVADFAAMPQLGRVRAAVTTTLATGAPQTAAASPLAGLSQSAGFTRVFDAIRPAKSGNAGGTHHGWCGV